MTRFLLPLLALGVAVAPAAAAPQKHLNIQVDELVKLVADALLNDVALKGKTVSYGAFGSKKKPDSRYGPELLRRFKQEFDKRPKLAERVVAEGELALIVTYDLADSATDTFTDGQNVLVIKITATIEEGNKAPFSKSVEVNETDDLGVVMGLTVAPAGNQQKQNEAVRKAAEQNRGKPPAQVTPTFQVKEDTLVGVPGSDKFFVEVLVKETADGPAKAIKPTANPSGNAFVDVKPDQFYELVIHNRDKHPCIARITIDGQNAINRFNADGVVYDDFLVTPEAKSGLLRGWLHTTKPRPKEKDNVFAFAVKEYYPGADKEKAPTPGEVGVITVQFATAWEEGHDPPGGREVGRITEKGQPLKQDLAVKKMQHGDFFETISIRYSPTAK